VSVLVHVPVLVPVRVIMIMIVRRMRDHMQQ
jgi:hypothetical protein